jgi:hemerythrin
MAYLWDSNLETGYELIDKQHKQLVKALNDLVEANQSGRGEQEVMQTLEFLTAYTIKHFSDEEALQVKFGYPEYLNHKRIHNDFKLAIKAFTERIIKEGPSVDLISEVSDSVGSWLLNHIKGDDFTMATFIKVASKG